MGRQLGHLRHLPSVQIAERLALADATMLAIAGLISAQPRVFRPQSGLTQSCSADRPSRASPRSAPSPRPMVPGASGCPRRRGRSRGSTRYEASGGDRCQLPTTVCWPADVEPNVPIGFRTCHAPGEAMACGERPILRNLGGLRGTPRKAAGGDGLRHLPRGHGSERLRATTRNADPRR